jgi:hypothetical protein
MNKRLFHFTFTPSSSLVKKGHVDTRLSILEGAVSQWRRGDYDLGLYIEARWTLQCNRTTVLFTAKMNLKRLKRNVKGLWIEDCIMDSQGCTRSARTKNNGVSKRGQK